MGMLVCCACFCVSLLSCGLIGTVSGCPDKSPFVKNDAPKLEG